MPPANVAVEPLGNLHKKYNQLVQDAVANKKTLEEKSFTKEKDDLSNLIKIDLACHNKDIDYIISVLKSDDMFYVSRAIKQSTWLIEDQYAHIINPEYLNEQLFPQMKTKASIKLLKHIRHYLKVEERVEQFYENEKSDKVAAKWLSRCSIPFIEKNIEKLMPYITDLEFKRLCEKSVAIFRAAMKNSPNVKKLQAASFLLHSHPDVYLDIFDTCHRYHRPTFGAATTELIMKQTPGRIMDNLFKYIDCIHVSTFVKFIKREEIKDFLFNLANKEVDEKYERQFHKIFHFEIVKQFIRRMPKDEQFEFVKKVYLDKENIMKIEDESLKRGTEMFAIKLMCAHSRSDDNIYRWYEFAPFNVAFAEIKKLIESETDIYEKYSMFNVLLNCAASNTQDLLAVLYYYNKTRLNDDIEQKREFINNLLSQSGIYKNDDKTWNAFIEILINMNVYTENDNQEYVRVIIMYHILQNKQVSEMIEKSFSFSTLKSYRDKLNHEEQNKVFDYLYSYIVRKVESNNVQNEIDFDKAIETVSQLLDLLLDWDKQLIDYPFALDKIKELVRLRKDNSWKNNLEPLYNKKKSWRRLMFEESVLLKPSQDVCINALKHDPGLLARYSGEVEAICCDDKVSLKQLLRKLRIYWPESLAESWKISYLARLENLKGHKALIRGIFTLLPQEPLLGIITKYAPAQPKIDWNKTDELTLGLQRSIAKNMHIARPQPSPDAILLYAKGDFLQYALPSLLAIYYNIDCVNSQEEIQKLLNAPVSLQKHGLRFAFIKLKHEELKYHLSNTWKTSKNMSIRAVSFVLLFNLMCKEKDIARAEELWEILELFIDNLSFKEDKKLYEILPRVQQVPDTIKPKFLVKSYEFLKKLLPHLKVDRGTYEYSIRQLITYTREIMVFMNPEFVANVITEYLDKDFYNGDEENLNDDMLRVITAYILCAKDEITQTTKYEKLILPLLLRSIEHWNETDKKKCFIRQHVEQLLLRFAHDLDEYVISNKMIIPTKMFTEIQKQLDKLLDLPRNYIMLTMWKLIVKMTNIIEKNESRDTWLQICSDMVPEFGKYCLDVLREDVKSYFSCIYVLFAKVLNMSIRKILPPNVTLKIYEVMLSDTEFIQAFLMILNMLPENHYNYCHDEKELAEVRNKIHNHPSVEIKMHYYSVFNASTDDNYEDSDSEE